jgi:hypothetical protein
MKKQGEYQSNRYKTEFVKALLQSDFTRLSLVTNLALMQNGNVTISELGAAFTNEFTFLTA